MRAAVRYMRSSAVVAKFDIAPKRIGAFRGSAGGSLAALLGVEGAGSLTSGSRVAAVAELSGPTNLTGDGSEFADFRPLELSSLGCASFEKCPQAVHASPPSSEMLNDDIRARIASFFHAKLDEVATG